MNLLNTINKLGHCLRAVIKPVNIVLAVATIAAAMSIGEVQGQNNNFKNTNMEVTETGYGELFIKNENNNPVANAKSTWTPVDVPGDSIPNPYVYFSDNAGTINYEVLVFHDTGVGIQNNYHIEVVQARPNPSTDFTFNFFANERPNNSIQINSINGALIGRYGVTDYNNHVAIYHVDLSDKADGIYTATATIDGEPHFSKIVKVNGSYSGNLGSSAKEVPPIEPINKSVLVNEAIYDVSIEAEGYYTLTDQRTVVVDENDIGVYTLISNEAPPIDNQDLSGIVTNTNTGNPINNALIEVEVVSSGQLYNATSSSDGSFTVEGLPLGEDILFRAGGVTGKYSISNFPNTTISEVINPADSVNDNFNVSLPNHLPSSTTLAHAKDQNLHGTNQDTIWFYQGNSVPQVMKENNRTYFLNLQAEENNNFFFAESFTELTDKGINIEFGTYNTNSYEDEIITPLGNILYPVTYANSTMGNGNYIRFVHEIKRALGYKEVAWPNVESVMEANPQDFTLEDKDIAREISRMYWNAIYQEEKTWIPMQYLSESMTGNKSGFSNVKDVKARIDELKEIADQKANYSNNNNTDTFKASSSYGDVEVSYSQPKAKVEQVKK